MKAITITLVLGLGALAAARLLAEGDCSPILPGSAPIRDPNSVQAFHDDPVYSDFATNATTPAGYTQAFVDASSAYQRDESYISYEDLSRYSTEQCASLCTDRVECKAFNIFVLRMPTQEPGIDCPDPPASASYRCSLFKDSIAVDDLTNVGQDRGPPGSTGMMFRALIRGSNGYNLETSSENCTATVTTVFMSFIHHTVTKTATTTVYG